MFSKKPEAEIRELNDRPNILFVFTDQQSAGMMSCAGNEYVNTPAMDSLAAEGVRFERAYCTNPVCAPSRFSLMTGRMPSEIELRWNGPVGVETIPEEVIKGGLGWLVRSAGYDVAYGGKEHLPKMNTKDLGFDHICEDERDGLADACVNYIKEKREKPFLLVASFINPHDICYMALRDYKLSESSETQNMIETSRQEIQALDEALRLPDDVSTADFFENYCPPLPDNFEPQDEEPEGVRYLLERRKFRMATRENYTDEQWRLHRWAYCRLTEKVDAQIGRVLDALRESGKDENTVVIFTSDHGDMDSAHRMEHKTALYEEACRIPLIIKQPDAMEPGICGDVVSNGLDLLPTICDYAGIEPPSGLMGKSLRKLVDGTAERLDREYIPIEGQNARAIVTGDFKYVMYDDGNNREQLADLKTDPGETQNFASSPEYSDALHLHQEIFRQHFLQS